MDDLVQKAKPGNSYISSRIISTNKDGSAPSHLTWISDRRHLRDRLLQFGILSDIESWPDYQENLIRIASVSHNDMGRVALALYDSPEVWRLKAFEEFINADYRPQLTDLISELSTYKYKDPFSFFPCVATTGIYGNFALGRSKMRIVF